MQRLHRALGALLVAPLLLSACAPGTFPLGGSPSPSAIGHPTGSDELLFGISWTGGFVPVEFHFTALPPFTLLGDGTVLVGGPQIEIFPGPALPNIQARRLSEEGIQLVLQRIAATGLFADDHDYSAANRFVMDANTTVFTLNTDDHQVVVSIYALGIIDPANVQQGIPAEEVAAHQQLQALNDELLNLDQNLPDSAWTDAAWHPFEPAALRLLVTNVDGQPPDASGLGSEPRPWPTAGDPAAFGDANEFGTFRCGVVSGEDGATWLAELEQANQLSRWSFDGHVYQVMPRPLLPHEPLECPTTFQLT